MNDTIDSILLDNLKDAIKLLQRYMTVGLTSAGCILVLAAIAPRSGPVSYPGLPVPVPPSLALAVSVCVYWYSGVLCTVLVARTEVIADTFLAQNDDYCGRQEVLRATLTYASIPTVKAFWPRIALVLSAAFLAVAGAIVLFGESLIGIGPICTVLVLIMPYLRLAWQLRVPLGTAESTDARD